MSYWPKIPDLPPIPRTPEQQIIYRLLDPKVSIDAYWQAVNPYNANSAATVEAYKYVKKHHPERLAAWLERHPGFKVPNG